jgi:hypothetical protein
VTKYDPADTNKDGTVSFEEWKAAQGGGGGSASTKDITGAFAVTGMPTNTLSGLRSPDRIDDHEDLEITTSLGVQKLPAEQMVQLQTMLQNAGLTPDGFKVSGNLDPDTKKALLELKATSRSTGLSDLATLQRAINTQTSLAATGGSEYTPTATVTEPTKLDAVTVRGMFRDVLQQRLGREPTADEYHDARKKVSASAGGQDVTTNTPSMGKDGTVTTRVTHSDDTEDPSPADVLDDMSRRGALGREANTVTAASFFDVIANRVGG